jgi:hypothetical protein
MKKLVWSTAEVVGGARVTARLPAPPDVAGPFQDVPASSMGVGKEGETAPFYRDAIVLAYPTPAPATQQERPAISASTGVVGAGLPADDKLAGSIQVPIASAEQSSWRAAA